MTTSNKKLSGLMAGLSLIALTASLPAYAVDLSGRITAASDNSALEGAKIIIKETGQRVYSRRDGAFRFPNLKAGEYTLEISYFGAETSKQVIAVPAAGLSGLVIKLKGTAAADEILVIGQRGSMNSAIARQRASETMANYLTSDNAGNVPDQNIAEAARRIVGLSVELDQGEGRYVTVRGIDSNLNTTSFNGVALPAPETGTRKVALDIIPSDMLETLEVKKSATPDMDGNFIGGNIDVRTISGFDRKDLFIKGKLEGSYNELEEKYSPMGSLTMALPVSDTFAIAGSISYKKRRFGSHNIETGGEYIDYDGLNVPGMEELELRDYQVTRERTAAALNLDFRPSENHQFYIRSMFTDFSDQEYRNRMEISYDKGDFDADRSSGNEVYYSDFRADRELKDRLEVQKIYSVTTGGESVLDALTLEYSLSYAHAQEKEPERFDITFRQKGLSGGVDMSNPLLPRPIFTSHERNNIQNPELFELDAVERLNGKTEDDRWIAKLDARWDRDFGDYSGYIKAGLKYDTRNKTAYEDLIEYEDFEGTGLDGLTLFQSITGIDYDTDPTLANYGVAQRFGENRLSVLNSLDPYTPGGNQIASIEDFDVTEDIYSAYAMGSIDYKDMTIIAGVRMEHTETKAEGLIDLDGDLTPLVSDISYTDFLPSINMKYTPKDNLIVRAAYFKTIVRPNFADYIPSGEAEIEDGLREGEAGNPDLQPYNADNFDLAFEWYPKNNTIVAAGVFYKKLGGFIYNRTLDDVTYFGTDYSELTLPQNGRSAELYGFEANVQTALDMLPAPFDGIILGANYTYTDSKAYAELDGDEIEVTLPRTSEHVASAILGYEKGGFSGRIALSYQSEYLDELFSEGDDHRYLRGHMQLDIQASYEVMKGVRFYGEVSNLTNEPYYAVLRHGDTDYLGQREEYKPTITFGVKLRF